MTRKSRTTVLVSVLIYVLPGPVWGQYYPFNQESTVSEEKLTIPDPGVSPAPAKGPDVHFLKKGDITTLGTSKKLTSPGAMRSTPATDLPSSATSPKRKGERPWRTFRLSMEPD